MKPRVTLVFFLFLFLAGYASLARADLAEDLDQPLTREQMTKLRDRVDTLRMWKLTKALDLDEKTSARLFPVLKKYDKKRGDLQYELAQDIRELRESLAEKQENRIRTALAKAEVDHKALQGVNEAERAELKEILTPEQQARYILFQIEFARDLRKWIGEARGKRLEKP
jgi:Spy/CpxP family protein refolding chaperone